LAFFRHLRAALARQRVLGIHKTAVLGYIGYLDKQNADTAWRAAFDASLEEVIRIILPEFKTSLEGNRFQAATEILRKVEAMSIEQLQQSIVMCSAHEKKLIDNSPEALVWRFFSLIAAGEHYAKLALRYEEQDWLRDLNVSLVTGMVAPALFP